MKYRGVEYYVAQGVEAGTWKFSTSMNDKIRTVRGKSRQDAAKVGKWVWGYHVIACPFHALSDQADWAAASLNLLASKERPCATTLQPIRASLLASAIARTLRCSRFLAASIQVEPWSRWH